MSEYKTLIISQQVEEALQVAAATLIGQGRLSCDQDSDHITYRYNHPEYGTQSLIITAINTHWSTVSFAGHELFLDLIGSQGWVSSSHALVEFFAATGNPVDFDLELSYFEVSSELTQSEYAVLVIEDSTLDLESMQSMINALTGQSVTIEVTESVDAVPTAPEVDDTEEVAVAVTDTPAESADVQADTSAAPEEPVVEDVVESVSTTEKTWTRKLLDWGRTPVGLTVCGLGVAAVGAGVGYAISRVTD